MRLLTRELAFYFAILICVNPVFAQQDSLIIFQDELGVKDIHITKEQIENNKVYTASSTLNQIEELPYTVYVVTGEEILQRGLFTLTDVLKLVPGFFVSQPGSAVHGESFMVNGLYGNTHAKIMINNLPIKPYNLSGLPIGEQLPIRQAERIEIIYGPSAVNVGTDAGAASINIVTRKSDRPVYVNADLSLGSSGYRSMNVLFGGKIGKNKKTLRFNAYGSSSLQQDINIPIIDPLLDPLEYPLVPFPTFQDSVLQRNQFPQTSRQFSLDLSYRSLNFSFIQMFRTTHSALGSTPGALNYWNPFTTYGENISIFNFTFEKKLKKIGFKYSSGVASTVIDEASSFNYINPFVKQLHDSISEEKADGNSGVFEQLVSQGNETYFNGRRFVQGSDTDIKVEPSISFFPTKNIEILTGANVNVLINNFYSDRNLLPASSSGRLLVNTNLFVRAYLKFEKLNFILGLSRFNNVEISLSSNGFRGKLLPQFSGLFKIKPNIRLRASYSNSYLIPSTYWRDRSEAISKLANPIQIATNETFELNPQETKYAEIGLAWEINKTLKTDFSFFNSSNSNLINFITREDDFVINFGYDNSSGLSSNVNGLKFSLESNGFRNNSNLNIKSHFTYYFGEQELLSGETLDAILAQPKFIGQFSLSGKILKKVFVTMDHVFIGGYASRDIKSLSEYNQQLDSDFYAKPTWTANIGLTANLNNNFRMFAKYGNINFNFIPGISATGGPDDLPINLQRNFYYVVGVSYTLD